MTRIRNAAKRRRAALRPFIVDGCSHHRRSTLDYLAWHAWAEARYKAGDRQTRCKVCKLWLFPEEVGRAS